MTRIIHLAFPRSIQRNVIVLCIMAFLADLMFGIIGPTFSLFAISLGGTLVLVGTLGGLVNLTRLASTIPAGMGSDLWGRKGTLLLGFALLTVATGAYGLVQDPDLLFVPRLLEGAGTALALTVGIAALSEAAPPLERGSAIGLYMTSMGLGYSLGGALGGSMVERLGFARAYQLVALVPLVTLVILWRFYRPVEEAPAAVAAPTDVGAVLRLALHAYLLPANLGNFLVSMTFSATVLSFFPLYAASAGVSAAVFGAFFGLRSLLSTLVRMPVGMLAPGRTLPLMTGAMAVIMIAMGFVPATSSPPLLLVLLCAEGFAYGSFITVGQTHASEYDSAQRGTVLGVYSAFGSFGSTLGSVLLGLLAQSAGLSSVFYATSVLLAIGIAPMLWLGRSAASRAWPDRS
jgi:MFS family permease